MLSLKIKLTSRRQELYQGEKWELAQAFVQVLFVCKSKAVFFVRKMNFILMVPMDLSKSHNCHSLHAPHGDNGKSAVASPDWMRRGEVHLKTSQLN